MDPPHLRGRRIGVLAIGVVAWFALAIVLGGPASAHANLERSDPADGQALDAPPDRVTITFTETLDPELSTVDVLGPDGNAVPTGELRPAAGDPKTLVLPLTGSLTDGTYTVSWRVVSTEDGHVTAGSFAFGVGEAPAPAPGGPTGTQVPTPSALGVLGKLLLYTGLAVAFAAGVLGLVVFAGRVPGGRVLPVVAAAVALVGSTLMLLAERALIGVGFADLIGSAAGRPYVWLVAATTTVVVASAAAAAFGRGRAARVGLVAIAITAAASMLIRAENGHAASPAGSSVVQVGVQWFHFMAAGAWIGGLLLIALHLRRRVDGPGAVGPVRRFSRFAGWAVLVVVVAGVLRMIDELGGFGAILRLFRTDYGTTLAIKLALVAALIVAGAWNRMRSIPRLAEGSAGPLRTVVVGELMIGVVVFGLTGLLTGFPPAPSPEPDGGARTLTVEGADFATTTRLRLSVSPGTPGENRFIARISDYDSGDAVEADRVALRFASLTRPDVQGSRLELSARAGAWEGRGTQLSLAGLWRITALVQTAQGGTEIPVVLSMPDPSQTVDVSRAEGQPTLHTTTFANGDQLQGYTDPGTAGPNQVHLTAFDPSGTELRLSGASIVAVSPDGEVAQLTTTRFSPGHFVANTELDPGRWTFGLTAETGDGRVLVTSFDEEVA